ncbi:TIGR00730 family Rossman fold protein [Ramlibacter sp. AN1015]|uniref:LOG family protein n=1 Tax=Ramlibacter sp. AN1015 TaxID=3133428 RepID=UPI0030BFF6D8
MTPSFSICVYCGSRPGATPSFLQSAEAVGRWIGAHGGQLVYGGGNTGLMGTVAEATLRAGGRVVGIIPQSLVDREMAKRECTELHVVHSMHERKHMMAERADAFLALPGGIGTFEELFEVWTWRQLGYHDKPVGLLDVEGYYQPLLRFLDDSVATGFVSEQVMSMLRVGHEVPALLQELVSASRAAPQGEDLSRI